MNKTKILTSIVFAGFFVQQSVFSQSAVRVPADSELYAATVSNAVRFSTSTDTPSGMVVTVPVTNGTITATVSNESSSSAAVNDMTATNATITNSETVSATNGETATVIITNPPSSTTIASEMAMPSATSNPPAGGEVSIPVTNETAAVTVSNSTGVPVESNETAEVEATNLTAASDSDVDANEDTDNQQNAITNKATAVVPQIRFQEIPITSAIDNLARQAGINYLLDPKIGYGQPDANGQIKTEPSLSLRWENITPKQALLAVLDNYGLQLILDPKTKIAKITVKDPTAPPPLTTEVYQLAYADVSNMENQVTTILTDHRSKVVTDVRTSTLTVVATDREQTDVAALIAKLDKPTRQVLIETRFIEISSNPSTSKGVDWSGTLQAQNVTFGNGTFSQTINNTMTASQSPNATTTTTTPGGRTITTTSPTSSINRNSTVSSVAASGGAIAYNTISGFNPAAGFLTANGLNVVMSFINSSSDAQVVSTPRIVTLDNEQATIAVTRAFPIFQTTAGTQGSPGGSSVNYSNVGIVLEVTPHISANDYIWLKVLPKVSSFFDTVTKTVAGVINQADEFDSREIDTQVLIPNANTLVMGGMVKDSPNAKYTKVPLLGDIPVLGWAFRSETKSMDKQNLLIFITPTIITDSDFQPTVTEFMKSRPITEKEPLDPNSAWDSGKPRDWSNPQNTDPTQIIINQKTTE